MNNLEIIPLPTDEPEALLPEMCSPGERISLEKVLTLLQEELSAEQFHKDQRSVHALRAGALFHVLKQQMGGGYSGFWKLCEERFRVSRATISKKMRLVTAWARKSGASAAQISQLAESADFDKDAPLGQLVMAFVGDNDVSELYRREKIVESAKPGGYRPNEEQVQAWLAEHHPELVGKKFCELSGKRQMDFQKMALSKSRRMTPEEARQVANHHADALQREIVSMLTGKFLPVMSSDRREGLLVTTERLLTKLKTFQSAHLHHRQNPRSDRDE